MLRIIEDLLDVAGPLGGRVSVDPAPVDLVAVVRGAFEDVRPAADAGGLRLTLTCRAAPAMVAGDALRLQQIVVNLLANAIQYTPADGRIDVELDAVGSGIKLRVSDTGQGISAEFLPRVFDRFTRADDAFTQRRVGLGLGLAIVRALVERHGGTVQADNGGRSRCGSPRARAPRRPGDCGPMVSHEDRRRQCTEGLGPASSAAGVPY